MRKSAVVLGVLAMMASGVALAQTAAKDPVPYWAYPVPEKTGPAPKLDDTIKKHVPHSKASFTEAQTNDRFHVPDWHPEGHPAMPTIVSSGKAPDIMACGYCHLPNGHGRPENAPLAGQPAAYLIEQVTDMKAGRRKSSEPRMGSIKSMVKIASALSPQDLKTAAEYFEKAKYTKWIRVVETDMAPKTEVSSHNMLVPKAGGGKEKLGDRIIEMPANLERTELRDAASGFIAYVPKGSIARGKKLVESGAGAFPCSSCHGDKLKGDGNVPSLAGRSPSMIVRQLYDFKAGTRGGPNADPMKQEVANMTAPMRLDIAAYLASLNP